MSRKRPTSDLSLVQCQRNFSPFCVCDLCEVAKARIHIEADLDLKRDWSCQCGACRRARQIEPHLEIDVRFDRIANLQKRLDAVRALKAELKK
jgi:hypothetical protein